MSEILRAFLQAFEPLKLFSCKYYPLKIINSQTISIGWDFFSADLLCDKGRNPDETRIFKQDQYILFAKTGF